MDRTTRTRWLGLLAVLVGASVLGWSAIFVRWAEAGGATALTVGLYRMLFALPGAALLTARARDPGATGAGRRWAALAGVAFFLDLFLWHLAMERTTAANATLITTGLSPVWVALFSVAVFSLRYRWIAWVGQAAGLGGALLLACARGARGGTGRGEAIAFAASFCYAGFTLAFSRSRRTLAAPRALFWASLSSCACFAMAVLVSGHALAGYTTGAWLSLVGLGLLVQLVGWWCNSWGLGHVDVASGALALQAQQVATLFLAAWLLDEPLKPLGLVGAALIIGGIVSMSVGAAPAPRRAAVVMPAAE